MQRNRWSVLALSVALLVPATVLGAAEQFAVDPYHSSVTFSIRHLLTPFQGRFQKFTGSISYDAAQPAASSVEFSIETASIDTNNGKRDDHLRSADFFDAEKFPTLTFKSEKVTAKSKEELEVTGSLTVHGVTKSVTVPVKVLGVIPAKDSKKAGFSAQFTVNRKDFGIVWNKVLDAGSALLGDDVTLTVILEADLKK